MNDKVQEMHLDECGCKVIVHCGGGRHKCECKAEFAEVYSLVNQDLSPSLATNQPGQVVLLENTIYSTSGVDVSQAASTGAITVNVSGWYDVVTGVTASLNPIQSPLLVWTISLFRNGVMVPGSTFANMTISPEQKANGVLTDVFVHLNAGDKIFMANTSTSKLSLLSASLGANAQPSSAFMKIRLMKAD